MEQAEIMEGGRPKRGGAGGQEARQAEPHSAGARRHAGHEPHKKHGVFSRAQRHSRRVRRLKLLFPAAAVIIAIAVFLRTFYPALVQKFTAAPKAEITLNSDEGESSKLVMTAPKVEGYTKDGRPYALTAQKAVQDPAAPGLITLQAIGGSVPLSGRGAAKISAEGALFDNINGRLRFDQPLSVETEDGTRAYLLSADINMQSGQMSTADPVDIKSPTQHLTAASMRITESGALVRFGGPVHITLDQSGAGGAPAR